MIDQPQQQQQQPYYQQEPILLLQQADEAYRHAPDAPACDALTSSRSNNNTWWQQRQTPPPHAVSTSSSSSASSSSSDDTSEDSSSEQELEMTSWANFPVCVRMEQHPSMLSLDWYYSSLEEEPQEQPVMIGETTTTTTPELLDILADAEDDEEEEPAPDSEEGPDDEDDTDFFIVAPEQLLKLNRIITTFHHETATPAAHQQQHDGSTASTTFGWGDFPLVAQQCSFDYPWRYHKADEDEEIVPLVAPVHHMKPISTTTTTTTTETTVPLSPLPHDDDARTVSFGQVRIREYGECLGDHPWCPQYPVSLDWSYDPHETVVDVQVYEEQARETCCWSSTPRRMEVLERRCRLARAMRITKAEIDVLETYRQEQVVQAEEEGAGVLLLAAARSEEKEEEEATTSPLQRIPARIVLPQGKCHSNSNESTECFLELEPADGFSSKGCSSAEWI